MLHTFVPIDPHPLSYDLGGFNDELLVDVAPEPIPSVPPHLWSPSKTVIVSDSHPGKQKQQAQIVGGRILQFHGERYWGEGGDGGSNCRSRPGVLWVAGGGWRRTSQPRRPTKWIVNTVDKSAPMVSMQEVWQSVRRGHHQTRSEILRGGRSTREASASGGLYRSHQVKQAANATGRDAGGARAFRTLEERSREVMRQSSCRHYRSWL